jgi:hypothetical protein
MYWDFSTALLLAEVQIDIPFKSFGMAELSVWEIASTGFLGVSKSRKGGHLIFSSGDTTFPGHSGSLINPLSISPLQMGALSNVYYMLLILVRENDLLISHHWTAMIRVESPVFVVPSSCPIGRAHPLTTPASRRLLMLMLPRLRTRGSLIRSFSDSAR